MVMGVSGWMLLGRVSGSAAHRKAHKVGKLGAVEFRGRGEWADVPAQAGRVQFLEIVRELYLEKFDPLPEDDDEAGWTRWSQSLCLTDRWARDVATEIVRGDPTMRTFSFDPVPFDLVPARVLHVRNLTPEEIRWREQQARSVAEGSEWLRSQLPPGYVESCDRIAAGEPVDPRLADVEDPARSRTLLVYKPTAETRAKFEARVRDYWTYLRESFEQRLRTYCDEREAAMRSKGLKEAPAKNGDDHFRWLARYQCGGESTSAIAKTKGAVRDRTTVVEAVHATAKIIGLTLRVPAKGGRPRKPVGRK